jgi:hypothetical protein
VIKIIRSRTTVGEYQPHRRDTAGKLIPDGDPIKGYYPAVIDESVWDRANAAVTGRRTNAAGRPSAEVANLIRGLARCECGSRMLFLNKGKPPKGGCYYVCSKAARENKCGNKRLWNAKNVGRYVLHQIDPAHVAAAFEPEAAGRTATSAREFDSQLLALSDKLQAPMGLSAEYAGKSLGEPYKALAEQLNDTRCVKSATKRRRPSGRNRIFDDPVRSKASRTSSASWQTPPPKKGCGSGRPSFCNSGRHSPRSCSSPTLS